MILRYDKFTGKIKDDLQKEEAVELISLITDLKPQLPKIVTGGDFSKLIDNINYYTSEDGQYNISVYFRESDKYYNSDGTITHGNFKSLFKVTITKIDSDLKVSYVKDYLNITSNIIKDVYPESKLMVKFKDNKLTIEEFNILDDNLDIDRVVLILRIL